MATTTTTEDSYHDPLHCYIYRNTPRKTGAVHRGNAHSHTQYRHSVLFVQWRRWILARTRHPPLFNQRPMAITFGSDRRPRHCAGLFCGRLVVATISPPWPPAPTTRHGRRKRPAMPRSPLTRHPCTGPARQCRHGPHTRPPARAHKTSRPPANPHQSRHPTVNNNRSHARPAPFAN